MGTLLWQGAKLLARARELRTLYVRNLSVNAVLQRLALRLGMTVVRALSAGGAGLQGPARAHREAATAPMITVADDSLRPQWNGAPAGAHLLDLSESVLP